MSAQLSLQDIEDLAQYALEEHGLVAQGWTFGWDQAKRRHGQTDFMRRRITLSKPIHALEANREEALDTILHEVAHVLAGWQHDHDAVWKATAAKVGARPQRCAPATAAQVPFKWHGACRCGMEKHGRHRRPPAHVRHWCRICGERISWWSQG